MAKCMKKGYAILYNTYPEAHKESSDTLTNKFKTELNVNEDTARRAERTFRLLSDFADYSLFEKKGGKTSISQTRSLPLTLSEKEKTLSNADKRELIVNINVQVNLPPTEKAEVYDKIFAALKKHFFSE